MWRQLRQLAQSGLELPNELRRPVTSEMARDLLQKQQASRAVMFLDLAKKLIYEYPASPYLPLLQWAGCEWSDLRERVNALGVDGALAELRDAGVYLTLEEFKRQHPIVRNGQSHSPSDADFDNPLLSGAAIEGTTSGSRARPSRVMYTWPFIADEAAHECLLYEMHGVRDAETTLWYPSPPGVAGTHNMLMDAKRGRAPRRWYSQIDPAKADMSRTTRFALPAIRIGARLAGVVLPAPEFADLEQADRVLGSLRAPCVVRGFASSLIRLAAVALDTKRDLSGVTFFSGGEPLTDERRAFVESTGAKIFPRYFATEAGLIAAGCPNRVSTDDMHVFTDRVALVSSAHGLLISTLSMHTGKVLFNTNLGDTGALSERTCTCGFGGLGFVQHLATVRSEQRYTLEGMTVMAADVSDAIGIALRDLHAPPDSSQVKRTTSPDGLERLTIVVSPQVGAIDESALVRAMYDALKRKGVSQSLAATLWEQASVLEIVREVPTLSKGSKLQ